MFVLRSGKPKDSELAVQYPSFKRKDREVGKGRKGNRLVVFALRLLRSWRLCVSLVRYHARIIPRLDAGCPLTSYVFDPYYKRRSSTQPAQMSEQK